MEEKIYTSLEFAEVCGSKQQTVLSWAQKHDVKYIGMGRRKVYMFTEADIERFKQREKPGRRWN